MKKFVIKVNGNVYEVEVEETENFKKYAYFRACGCSEGSARTCCGACRRCSGWIEVCPAPMPGTILDIKVSVGQSVNAGDVLCVLEAMKMENEIMAPAAGKVVAINTSKGASVNTGDALISLG